MEFSSARAIEQVVWQMRLADYPRSSDRARIDSLANGAPPIPTDDAKRDGVEVNVNDLSLTRLSHDARMQLYGAFNKPGNFFTASTDMGPVNKRQERGVVVTKFVNRYMKRSNPYYQCQLSKFALTVLHGIGPSNWENQDRWCPIPLEVSNVMLPSRTRLTFDNLPFFAIWRGYSPNQLRRLSRNPERNPGWNMEVVNAALDWADKQTAKLYAGTTWSEYWVPEKREERFKEDCGVYASDLVQTIDCWDFYYWDDAGDHEGWRRRIVFDAYGGAHMWSAPRGYGQSNRMPTKNLLGEKGMFLYTSGDRVVADNIDQIIHFQFADLSAKAPFTYHSVRSLGFLLYAVCHLQNRLRCSFSEAVFENLLMYMRVHSLDEAERALKVELAHRGIIDETVHFLSPAERWQPNAPLVELGLNEYKQIINDNSSSYVQNQNWSRDRTEKTKFQVMAEVQAMQSLISAAIQQAYRYQTSEYREIFRRFMKKDSEDADVRDFRAQCLARGVPEKLLVPDAWDIEPERILGGGNRTLEMAIAQQLMEWRSAFTPEAQDKILRKATLAITEDACEALSLVPHSPSIPPARVDAMNAWGSLMAGGMMQWRSDQNRIEIVQTLLVELDLTVQRALQSGGMVSPDKLGGMNNVLAHIAQLIAFIAQDPSQQDLSRKLAEASGRLANAVKGFEQQLIQSQQAAAQTQGSDKMAETQAKIAATMMTAQAKAENTRESHAQRTAQRQAQWELEQRQKEVEHIQNLKQKSDEHALQIAADAAKLAQQTQNPPTASSQT